MSEFRCGSIALIGRPNVGKSTLFNALVGEHLSITAPKPQTTRHRIMGVRTEADAQFMFIDSPGFQRTHRDAMGRVLNRIVQTVLAEADVIGWVVEAGRITAEDAAIGALLPGIGGSFTRFGHTEVLYVTEFAGLLLIFLGYRLNTIAPPGPGAVEALGGLRA